MNKKIEKNEATSVDEFIVNGISMGLSAVRNFENFYNYLFEYNILKNTTKQLIDVSIHTEEEKLNLFDHCQSLLTDLRSYFLYTEDCIDPYTLDTIKKKYIDFLDFIILLKPEIKEAEYLNKRNARNLFDNAFKSVAGNVTKQITKNTDNKYFYESLGLLNQEYETKANFYTAAENKPKVKKHFTEETWFIVGLKFVDGTVFKCKEIKSTGYSGGDFAELVFNDQKVNMSESEFLALKKKTRGNIGDTIVFLEQNKETLRNLFKKGSKYENQWRTICDYHKEQGGKIDNKFVEYFSKIYNVQIE